MGYLIDTCIWIDVERGKISPADVSMITGNDPVYISHALILEIYTELFCFAFLTVCNAFEDKRSGLSIY